MNKTNSLFWYLPMLTFAQTDAQTEFQLHCEWGKAGVMQLAPVSDVVVIVDVLSFSTCVEIANQRGAAIFPYPWKDRSAQTFAEQVGAALAHSRGQGGYSLSPQSLAQISPGTRLVLPSPNGSSLSLATGTTPTLTGCLRNCQAVAQAAMTYGPKITVIPAGEQWSDGTLRPAFEDWIGAGAILSYLQGSLSPEAEAAIASYQKAQPNLQTLLQRCSSGQELIQRGSGQDLDWAAALNVSDCVPTLVQQAYQNYQYKN